MARKFRALRKPRVNQPQKAARPNPKLKIGLGLWNFSDGLRNLIDGKLATSGGSSVVFAPGPNGIGASLSSIVSQRITLPDYSGVAASGYTAILVYEGGALDAGGNNTPWQLGGGGGFADELPYTNSLMYTRAFAPGAAGYYINGVSLPSSYSSGLKVLAVQVRTGSQRLSLNGLTLGTSTAAFTPELRSAPTLLGSPDFDTKWAGRRLYAFALDSRYWSDAEVDSIGREPWRLFEDRRILVPVGAAVGGASTGALSATLGAATLSAAGTLPLAGATSQALASLACSAAGSLQIAGSFAQTLAGVTLSAVGSGAATGALTVTLTDVTPAATGALRIAGTATQTLAAATLAAAGKLALSGALAQTLVDAALTATGELAPLAGTGALAQALADATLASAGAIRIAGTLTAAMDAATLAATGEGSAPGTGALTATLGSLTCTATGTVDIAGALGVQLGDLVVSAVGALALRGASSPTLGSLTLTAAGGSGPSDLLDDSRLLRLAHEDRIARSVREDRILRIRS